MALTVGSLFTLIVVLLVIGILLWLAFYVLRQFPPPEPLGRIIQVIIVVIAVLILVVFLLNLVGIGGGVRIS
jgi:hypothetical protein